MNHFSRARKTRSGQRTLTFPMTSSRLEIWNHLSDKQQQECRVAIRQLLYQVVLDEREVARDEHPVAREERGAAAVKALDHDTQAKKNSCPSGFSMCSGDC